MSVETCSIIQENNLLHRSLRTALPVILIAGLGCLVDVYDLCIFTVERVPSLNSLGVPFSQSMSMAVLLLNTQMVGMIVGGILWGILGDKKGRKAALFGSILIYSGATILNGFVNDIPSYVILRFLAGIGLAGEVGAAMTMAAEVMPSKFRSFGTATVGTFGCLGAVLASFAADVLSWRMAYWAAGAIGLFLLFARLSMKETDLFEQICHDKTISRGDLKLLLADRDRIWKLLRCVLAATPLWFIFAVMVGFAPELFGPTAKSGQAISIALIALYFSLGESFGEICSGFLSQVFRTRKIPMLIFVLLTFLMMIALLNKSGSMQEWYFAPLGFFIGYWSLVMTTTAEQFGTNLRVTATTLVPNLVRASAIPITASFCALVSIVGTTNSALLTGSIVFLASLVSIAVMEESARKELDFIEK